MWNSTTVIKKLNTYESYTTRPKLNTKIQKYSLLKKNSSSEKVNNLKTITIENRKRYIFLEKYCFVMAYNYMKKIFSTTLIIRYGVMSALH